VSGGILHAVEKYPLKLATFKRDYVKIEQWNKEQGNEVESPEAKRIIGAQALENANRRIMMNQNIISGTLRTTQGWMYRQGGVGKLGYYMSKVIFPIATVPSNYTIRTARAWGGLGEFAVRAMVGVAKEEKMSADNIDKMLFAFKQGLPGAALGILAYEVPNLFTSDDKHKFYVNGWEVPNWLQHHPYVLTAKLYSEAKNEWEKHNDIGKAALKVWIETMREVPYLNDQTIGALDSPKKLQSYLTGLVTSFGQPQFLKDIAEMTDKDNLTFKSFWLESGEQRKAAEDEGGLEYIWQTYEKGVPGLRQNVDVNKPTSNKPSYLQTTKTSKPSYLQNSKKNKPSYLK